MSNREDNVYRAKLAEQAERYDEMVEFMKNVAMLEVELTVEERNLLSVAYKNVIGARRSSWRIISTLKNMSDEEQYKYGDIESYKEIVETELEEKCHEILSVLKKYLIPSATSVDSKVFYSKMTGDYNRYLAEFTTSTARENAASDALTAYKEANDFSNSMLQSATHPIRLGLALNFSVFYYEIYNSPVKACRLAKAAIEEAIQELDSLDEENYKDATLIMQLLRDNLNLWTQNIPQDAQDTKEELQDIEDGDS